MFKFLNRLISKLDDEGIEINNKPKKQVYLLPIDVHEDYYDSNGFLRSSCNTANVKVVKTGATATKITAYMGKTLCEVEPIASLDKLKFPDLWVEENELFKVEGELA